jgi:hypothetical protein
MLVIKTVANVIEVVIIVKLIFIDKSSVGTETLLNTFALLG